MPSSGPSLLSLLASGAYGGVVLTCLLAMFAALSTRQLPSHVRNWAVIALVFGGLILLRLFDVEAELRDTLRDWAKSSGAYGDRQGLQIPLTIGIVIVAGLAAAFWIARSIRSAKGRRNVVLAVAQMATLAMLMLMALRTISFSALDKLLYGPLKLNWVGDIGASVVVVLCALYYFWVVRNGRKSRSAP